MQTEIAGNNAFLEFHCNQSILFRTDIHAPGKQRGNMKKKLRFQEGVIKIVLIVHPESFLATL